MSGRWEDTRTIQQNTFGLSNLVDERGVGSSYPVVLGEGEGMKQKREKPEDMRGGCGRRGFAAVMLIDEA